MTKFTKTFFVGVSVALLSVCLLWAQARVQRATPNQQTGFSTGFSYSSGGNPTTQLYNGEPNIVTDGGTDAGPIVRVYDGINAAWQHIAGEYGVGEFITFEGATADAFETILTVEDPDTGDHTFHLPDQNAAADTYAIVFSVLDTNALHVANSVWFNTNQMVFEGATADAFETLLVAQDADTGVHTFQLPDNNAAADTYNVMFSLLDTNALAVASSIWFDTDQIIFEGTGVDTEEIILTVEDPTVGDSTYRLNDNGFADIYPVMFSNYADNSFDTTNSVWGVTNGIHFEGVTADDWENSLQSDDPTVADAVFDLPNNANAGPFNLVFSTLDTNALDVANSVWFESNALVYEVTLDTEETRIGAVDPIIDSVINFNGSVVGTVMTARASPDGYSLTEAVPNPWRQNFIYDMGDCIALLDDNSAVAGVADTSVNNVVCNQSSFEYWVEQAAAGLTAALLSPNANGWLIELDDTANEGVAGRLFGGDDDFDVGWNLVAQTDAGYLEARVIITDSSETDHVLFGLLTREAYTVDAEDEGYNTYCLVGVDDLVADPRDIVVSEELNADGGANTDTTVDVVDGTAFTVRVVLEADGTCDVWVNGAVTNADIMTFDAADFVVPMFSVIASAGDGTPDPDVIIEYVEVGYLN